MSGNPMENVPPHLQQDFMRLMEEQQAKDSALMYNNLVERCFKSCITTFRAKTLDDKGKRRYISFILVFILSFISISISVIYLLYYILFYFLSYILQPIT